MVANIKWKIEFFISSALIGRSDFLSTHISRWQQLLERVFEKFQDDKKGSRFLQADPLIYLTLMCSMSFRTWRGIYA